MYDCVSVHKYHLEMISSWAQEVFSWNEQWLTYIYFPIIQIFHFLSIIRDSRQLWEHLKENEGNAEGGRKIDAIECLYISYIGSVCVRFVREMQTEGILMTSTIMDKHFFDYIDGSRWNITGSTSLWALANHWLIVYVYMCACLLHQSAKPYWFDIHYSFCKANYHCWIVDKL